MHNNIRKRAHLDSLEKYHAHMYIKSKQNMHMDESCMDTLNPYKMLYIIADRS
jgi:hypothetical protein